MKDSLFGKLNSSNSIVYFTLVFLLPDTPQLPYLVRQTIQTRLNTKYPSLKAVKLKILQ